MTKNQSPVSASGRRFTVPQTVAIASSASNNIAGSACETDAGGSHA
jgi:hypothetical protein